MQNKISKIHTKYLRYTHLQCAFDDFTNSYRHVLLELKIPFQVQVGVCTSICCNALYSMVLLYGNDVCLFFCLFFQSTNGFIMSNKKKILETFILSFTSFLQITSTHQSGTRAGRIGFIFLVTFAYFFTSFWMSDVVVVKTARL